MNDPTPIGIVAMFVGIVVCMYGYKSLRFIITVLGAWVGFFIGAGIVANLTGEPLLATPIAWVGAVVGALVLGALAYAFYQAAVVIGMASLGFSAATGILTAVGVNNATLIWVIGVVVAIALAVLALLADLPAGILIVLTAVAGASIIVTGALLILGRITLAELEAGQAPDGVPAWAGVVALALAVVGVIVQSRGVARDRRMRATWAGRAA